MYHASPGESSAMLLLKMLQPDEGIVALGEDILGFCQSLRRQQACAFMCGPQGVIYCATPMLYLQHDDKNHHPPKRFFFCTVTSDLKAIVLTWQSFGGKVELGEKGDSKSLRKVDNCV